MSFQKQNKKTTYKPAKNKQYVEKSQSSVSGEKQKKVVYQQKITKQEDVSQRYQEQPSDSYADNFYSKQDNFPQSRQKIKTSRIPEYIIDNSDLVDQEKLGLQVQTRYIRKYFLEKFLDAAKEDLRIKQSKYTPCVFFEYCNPKRRLQYVEFRDLVKCNKKRFQEKSYLISFIYQQLYDKVDPRYFGLAIFGIKVAQQKRIAMTKSSVFRQNNIQTQLMFYYRLNKSQGKVNLLLIDKYLNFVYFQTDDILKHSQDFQEEYEMYEKFKKNITHNQKKVLSDAWDILQNEEITFNQKEIKYFGESLENLQKIFQAYKQKAEAQLRIIQQQLQEKKATLEKLEIKESNQISVLQKLEFQVFKIELKIDQMQKVLKDVQQEGKILSYKYSLSQWFYIKSTKKIILAQKQLTSKLPILQKKKEILNMLRSSNHKPIIIEGETGSGKSTQLPQILLQFLSILDEPQSKPILVTQPRRLATRTLAQRVAQQLGEEKPNNFVDFKNTLDKQINPNAKIVFKLDRLVLDEISEDPLLKNYSCLVIDEAHQRTISIDVLIGLVRNILNERSDFRVIITSASMDVELFEKQFQTKALKVSGRLFNVDIQYKDYQLQTTLQKITKSLDEEILRDENSLKETFKGHVLVFCSSIDQINKLTELYTKKLNSNRFSIFPLHGKIAPEEQRKAFLPSKQHKIIFASRIAQTAITIDDVRVVVDPGEDIELVYDQRYKFSSMKLRNISQSSAKQRAGRAGRTAPGHCFRLYSEKSYHERPLGKVPEMQNSSLDTVVLRLKSLGIENVIQFPYISKPDREGLQVSIQNLKMIGGLNQKEEITAVGNLLIAIPIQPMLARSVVEALLFDYVNLTSKKMEISKEMGSFTESIIEILCMIVNSSNLFHIIQENQNEGDLRKFEQFQVLQGDFWFLRSIYREFKQNLKLVGDKAELNFWFKEFYLSKKTLKQVKQLEFQITKIISSITQSKKLQFQKMQNQLDDIKQKLRNCKSQKDVVLVCLITSFIPNLCVYSEDPHIGYTLISQRRPITIYGTSTLALVGLNTNSPKWIIAYDFYTSERGRFYCKIAQGIDFNFLKNTTNKYAWKKFQLGKAQTINPFYQKVWENTLPIKVYSHLKQTYTRFMNVVGEQAQQRALYQRSVWIFNDNDCLLKIFVLKDKEIQADLKQRYLNYFNQIKSRYLIKEFRYSYLGNTLVIFNCDFTIKSMEKIVEKDLLISEYAEEDSKEVRNFVKQRFSDISIIEMYPFSRNIKIVLNEQADFKKAEETIQVFLNQAEFKKRPKFRIVPRNQRHMSKSKIILIFYVENLHQKFDKKSQKYYKMLKTFIEQQDNKLQLSTKSDIQWKDEISYLLQRVKVDPEKCTINVWGNYESETKMSQFVQLYAQINSFESGIYQKLQEFQGKRSYLGCDKLFIKLTYQQIISFPTQTVFNALKQQFLEVVIGQRRNCKDLTIIEKVVRIRRISYVKIIGKIVGKSIKDRQVLMKAAQKIQMLFEPKVIELKQEEANFLLEIDKDYILHKIQRQFRYGITFQWNRFSRNLTVYCRSIYFDQISSKLKKYIKQTEFITNSINYRGKNLNQVVKILAKHKQKQKQSKEKDKMSYEILFNKKCIKITTLPESFLQIKKQIQYLQNPNDEQCQICLGKIQSAYILLNCSHNFCKVCILGLVRTEVSFHQDPIKCPKKDCSDFISIFDIQMILGEMLFQKVADERIRKKVLMQEDLVLCRKCYVIISLEERGGEQNCQICGYKRVIKQRSKTKEVEG